MSAPVLQSLLEQDGITLPKAGGAEKMIRCFSKHHDDDDPSMAVNVAKGVYMCHGCGIKGNSYQYLTDIRGYDARRAIETLKDMGVSVDRVDHVQQKQTAAAERRQNLPKRTAEIYPTLSKGQSKLVQTYAYRDADGATVCVIGRYETAPVDDQKPRKTFLRFTPRTEGGFWVCGLDRPELPDSDRRAKYPLYRLPEIMAEPDRQIWMVEGEKCAEIVSRLDVNGGPPPPVTCICGGTNSPLDAHDLSPLYGKKVLVLADADNTGRRFARKVAQTLRYKESEVRLFLPPGNDGYDIGDAASGGWKGVLEYIETGGGVLSYETVFPEETKVEFGDRGLGETDFFRVLGMEGHIVVILNLITNTPYMIPSASISNEGHLLSIAPLDYWEAMASTPDIGPKHRRRWGDALLRAAERKGQISTESQMMWQRGAVETTNGEIMFNVGDRVLVEDPDTRLLTVERALTSFQSEVFQSGPPIILKDDIRAETYAGDLYDAVMNYRWELPEHGRSFLGWLVASVVGGALRFRPIVWLTAPPNRGKTFLLHEILRPVLQGIVTDLVNTTEAGLAAVASQNALPVYIDEFEPEVGKENRLNDVFALMRASTSGDAARTRGRADGGYSMLRPRFSVFLSSVDRPPMSEAMTSRVTPIHLSTRGVTDWPKVRADIAAAVTPERCKAIRTRIIRHTAEIVRRTHRIEDEYMQSGSDVSTREAQALAALSAGAGFLAGISNIRIESHQIKRSTMYSVLDSLMMAMLQRKGANPVTVAQAITRGYFSVSGDFLMPSQRNDDLCDLLELHGIKMADESGIMFASAHPNLQGLLAGGPHRNVDIDDYLARLPSVVTPMQHREGHGGERKRARFAGSRRTYLLVPRTTLEDWGLLHFDRESKQTFGLEDL